jgi:hypothetical protein
MLVEVALTPHVFDGATNAGVPAWRDCLDELGHGFFPRNAASPVLAADLQEGGWMEEVRQTVGRIQDQATRWKVQGLADRFRDIVVPRPNVNIWPTDEREWADEAAAAHRTEPVGRIILSDGLHSDGYSSNGAPCCPLANVIDEAFWTGIENSPQVPMKISDQVALLRPICVHAHYLILKLPHIGGLSDDETPFATAVLRSAFDRPPGFSPVEVELHIDGDGLTGTALTNVVHNIRQELAQAVPAGKEVLLCVWPHFINRRLIAGVVTTSASQPVRAPRWGVRFEHVALPRDQRPPAAWSLIPPHSLAEVSDELDAGDPAITHRETLRF